jgi:large subunit ribosomal protein L25
MAEQLNVEIRPTRGKRANRRLRAGGAIPAVLYGHGEKTVSLSVPAHDLEAAIRHGSRLVTLSGAVKQQAFIREVQWDTWGTNVLHVDFTRVSAHEIIEVQVPVELRGEAPGLKEGGVVEQPVHEIAIECEASDVPEKIEVNINTLELGGSITADQLELSKTAKALCGPDTVIVQCTLPAAVPEEEEVVAAEEGEAEPEVIGRPAEAEQEDKSK